MPWPYGRQRPRSGVGRPAIGPEELADEARLADARVADDRDDRAASASTTALSKRRPQASHLGVPPDHRAGIGASALRQPRTAQQSPGWHAFGLALELERLDRLDLDGRPHELVGELADEDLVGRRGLLQAGGGVDRVAGDEALTGAGVAGHDLAGVHADAHGELDAPAALELLVRGCASAARMPSAARTARRASSSWTVGNPKTAMMASPMNFSMVPPCASSSTRMASK